MSLLTSLLQCCLPILIVMMLFLMLYLPFGEWYQWTNLILTTYSLLTTEYLLFTSKQLFLSFGNCQKSWVLTLFFLFIQEKRSFLKSLAFNCKKWELFLFCLVALVVWQVSECKADINFNLPPPQPSSSVTDTLSCLADVQLAIWGDHLPSWI